MNDQDPWTQHVQATLDTLWKAMGAQSPFGWTPPGGLSEETSSNEEAEPDEQHAA